MGIFSEMSMDGIADRKDEVAPFTLEPQAAKSAETFGDDAVQQAEAKAAPAALEYLKQQDEGEDESEPVEEEPAEPSLTPTQKKQAHEEAEAKRKAEWETKHQEKEENEGRFPKIL